jgi:hypothetical protein
MNPPRTILNVFLLVGLQKLMKVKKCHLIHPEFFNVGGNKLKNLHSSNASMHFNEFLIYLQTESDITKMFKTSIEFFLFHPAQIKIIKQGLTAT